MGGFFFISFRRSGLYFLDKSGGLLIFLARTWTWMLLHHAISTWRYSFFQFKKAAFELLRYLGVSLLGLSLRTKYLVAEQMVAVPGYTHHLCSIDLPLSANQLLDNVREAG